MRLLRSAAACAVTGDKRSTFYAKVKQKLITRPVAISPGARAWPDYRARVAGKSEPEIRNLVAELEAQRKAAT